MWNYVTVASLLSLRKMIASLNHMGFIMTPEQNRLLHPLTHQIPTQKAINLAYIETFSAMFDPICLHAACGQDTRKKLSPTDPQHDFSTKEGTIAAIKSECASQGLGIKTQIAYVLATVDHETAHRFQPVSEAFWLKDPDTYLKTHLPSSRYYPYYGRGYVQLTWKNNYEKYAQLLGLDLVNHPQLASNPEVALFVLVHGFKTGTFSGRKLSDYVDIHKTDFVNARRCINGLDKAQAIAEMARSYLATL